MTPNEAKKDLSNRLKALNMSFTKLRAKTVSFEGFGYGEALFIRVDGATFKRGVGIEIFKNIPVPSRGGYVVEVSDNCKWI